MLTVKAQTAQSSDQILRCLLTESMDTGQYIDIQKISLS